MKRVYYDSSKRMRWVQYKDGYEPTLKDRVTESILSRAHTWKTSKYNINPINIRSISVLCLVVCALCVSVIGRNGNGYGIDNENMNLIEFEMTASRGLRSESDKNVNVPGTDNSNIMQRIVSDSNKEELMRIAIDFDRSANCECLEFRLSTLFENQDKVTYEDVSRMISDEQRRVKEEENRKRQEQSGSSPPLPPGEQHQESPVIPPPPPPPALPVSPPLPASPQVVPEQPEHQELPVIPPPLPVESQSGVSMSTSDSPEEPAPAYVPVPPLKIPEPGPAPGTQEYQDMHPEFEPMHFREAVDVPVELFGDMPLPDSPLHRNFVVQRVHQPSGTGTGTEEDQDQSAIPEHEHETGKGTGTDQHTFVGTEQPEQQELPPLKTPDPGPPLPGTQEYQDMFEPMHVREAVPVPGTQEEQGHEPGQGTEGAEPIQSSDLDFMIAPHPNADQNTFQSPDLDLMINDPRYSAPHPIPNADQYTFGGDASAPEPKHEHEPGTGNPRYTFDGTASGPEPDDAEFQTAIDPQEELERERERQAEASPDLYREIEGRMPPLNSPITRQAPNQLDTTGTGTGTGTGTHIITLEDL